MNSHLHNENSRSHRRWARLAFPLLVGLATVASAAASPADDEESDLAVADLKGSWQAALVYSNTGCGPASALVNFTLDGTGTTHSATLVFHSGAGKGCGDSTSTQTFIIQTLKPDGSGTANLSCGPSCGWQFNIQVDRDRNLFNLVDVYPLNPGNFVAGTAIRQIKPDHDD